MSPERVIRYRRHEYHSDPEPREAPLSEYDGLLPKVLSPERGVLRSETRYAWQEFILDPEFDDRREHFTWVQQVCEKHRAAYHEKVRRLRR